MKDKNYKTITFYKFANSIGAVGKKDLNDLNPNDLLLSSFLFLNKNEIITNKELRKLEDFKEKYNRYLEYCIENNFIKQGTLEPIKKLSNLSVPDMSKIKVPDVKKELEQMGFDLENIGEAFKGLN